MSIEFSPHHLLAAGTTEQEVEDAFVPAHSIEMLKVDSSGKWRKHHVTVSELVEFFRTGTAGYEAVGYRDLIVEMDLAIATKPSIANSNDKGCSRCFCQMLPTAARNYVATIRQTVATTLTNLCTHANRFGVQQGGEATIQLRVLDPDRPLTWEFAGFSQHGEDGIVDYLSSQVLAPNRFFVEIGAGDGIQNCTAWLAFAKSYGGIWVEGNADQCKSARMADGRGLPRMYTSLRTLSASILSNV